MRTLPQEAIDIIKYAEAGRGINARAKDGRFLYRTCYLCPADVPTIGWGNINSVTRRDVGRKTITESESEALLAQDLKEKSEALERMLQGIEVNNNQFGALLALIHNIGPTQFAKSTVLKRLKQKRYADVPAAMRLFNKATVKGKKVVLDGLVLRRAKEGELFARPLDVDDRMVVGSTPVHEAAPVRDTLLQSRTVMVNGAGVAVAVGGAAHGVVFGDAEQVAAFLGMLSVALASLGLRIDDFLKGKR
jgi:lysozyme